MCVVRNARSEWYGQRDEGRCVVADERGVLQDSVCFTLSNFAGAGSGQILGTVTLNAGSLNVDSYSSLTISTFFLRGSGTLVVDVASNGTLKVQALCQISGGILALYSDGPVPNSKQVRKA